ncbi:MAG: hypothetical protein CME70_21865 [Halobacteriovorax sp.]|nr:hypothetical protein [Halobacteriovorax sp.]|tara:strand:- start:44769 stop:48140 length:3372 start_codon:yes stop_codon:yes gene_type:complete
MFAVIVRLNTFVTGGWMSETTVRTPNEEQKKSIEHSGGVLLSAGAGSGKTFVLVEHIIYLLKKFRTEITIDEFLNSNIKKYLSSIVMMTFTKKAAGEMATRLYKRVQFEYENDSEDSLFWQAVGKNLNSLYVGTIHGFCYKLISGNYFPELKSHFDIIDSDSQKTKLESLFDEWFIESKNNRDDFINEIVLFHRKQILNSVFEIFSNPDLRDFWGDSNLEDLNSIDMKKTMNELLESEDWGRVTKGRFDLSGFEGNSSKAWFKNIENFNNVVKSLDWNSSDSWKRILDFFESISSLRKTTAKDKSLEVDEYIEEMKSFRDFLKANGEGIISFLDNKEVFNSWMSIFFELFSYLEGRYEKLGGLTFSDLEYYVLKGLEGKPWAIKKIGEQYKYFIVDEFQDTSEVQYEILKNLVNQDFKKLFCVGDVKQAIYGFRGGELGVFRSCSKVTPQNLYLSKNYRSKNKIIHLNNTLFDFLFKVGVNYSGLEKDPVEVVYQEYPGEDSLSGCIERILVNVESEKKPNSKDMDILEAGYLFKSILEKSKKPGSIGILYKNLGASSHLIPLLTDAGISFTAQVKIPMNEGPLWALFSTLLEGFLTKNEEKKDVGFLCLGILKWIGSDKKLEEVEEQVLRFYKNISLLGFYASFEVIVSNLGICDSDYEKNFSKITHLNELAGEDPENLYKLMEEFGPERISVEFRFGDNPDNIFLMTAHGSKGLEFDHVFLGGIHTNGRKNSDSPLLGKLPGSIRWKISAEQKSFFKSPIYLLEESRMKKKDFAESKRLFYVACTRAQDSLTYVDLRQNGVGLKFTNDSWINGFRLYEEKLDQNSSFQISHVDTIEEEEIFEGRDKSSEISSPLFQKDSLGIIFRKNLARPLGLLAEVSVTRLATLAQCPRKFYLSNICKIDEEDLERIGFGNNIKLIDEKSYKEVQEEEVRPKRNTRERGILVHDAISRGVNGNLVCPLDIKGKEKAAVDYALGLLKEKNSHSFLSETPVKFPLFGQMISGTPDLVLRPKDKKNPPEIWDFKTGTQKENSELAYWFQLYCYGIQTCLEMGLSDDEEVLVSLVYVDEKKTVDKILTKLEIEKALYQEWQKLADFDQVNLDHCESCSFGNLCQMKSTYVARP